MWFLLAGKHSVQNPVGEAGGTWKESRDPRAEAECGERTIESQHAGARRRTVQRLVSGQVAGQEPADLLLQGTDGPHLRDHVRDTQDQVVTIAWRNVALGVSEIYRLTLETSYSLQ